MPTPRAGSGVAVAGTKIYIAGGIDEAGRSSAGLEVFETETRVWTRLPDMPTARDHLTAKAIRGLVYAIGGRAADMNTAEVQSGDALVARAGRVPTAAPVWRAETAGSGVRREGAWDGQRRLRAERVRSGDELWRSLAPLPAAGCDRHDDRRKGVHGGGGPRAASFSGRSGAAPASIRPGGADRIVNAASMQPGVSPGALAALFGERCRRA
jgi:hypothetical protein